MGSLIGASPPVVVEDVDDVPSSSVSIDIHPQNETDRDELAGQFAALLAAHTAETKRLEDRVEMLEALRLTEKMAEAAEAASSAAASAAQSAAEAAQLVKSAGEAVETAAAVMEVAREALKQLSADGAIPDLLADHCKSAAASARDVVCSCLEDAREDAEEFIEQTRKREQAAAVAVAEKRGGAKKK